MDDLAELLADFFSHTGAFFGAPGLGMLFAYVGANQFHLDGEAVIVITTAASLSLLFLAWVLKTWAEARVERLKAEQQARGTNDAR